MQTSALFLITLALLNISIKSDELVDSIDFNCIIVNGCQCLPSYINSLLTLNSCTNEEKSCYKGISCEKDGNGGCAWANSIQLEDCVTKAQNNPCVRAGCNRELCVEQSQAPIYNSCDILGYFKCYEEDGALCEVQANGNCDWTQTTSLVDCLNQNGFVVKTGDATDTAVVREEEENTSDNKSVNDAVNDAVKGSDEAVEGNNVSAEKVLIDQLSDLLDLKNTNVLEAETVKTEEVSETANSDS